MKRSPGKETRAGRTSRRVTGSRPGMAALCIALRESGIHGFGCFAARDIRRGERIIEYTGETIDRKEAVRRDNPDSEAYSLYVFEVSRNRYIDARMSNGWAKFINHSCECNCDIVRSGGRVFIVAAKDIPEGEELTYDYDFNDGKRHPCSCGSKSCRGFI